MIDSAAILTNARDAYSLGIQNQLQGQTKVAGSMTEQQARAAGEQFEAFFIGQMVELMHTDTEGDGMFSGGHAENVWKSMLNQEYGKEIAKSNPLGIADAVVRSLLQTQNIMTGAESSSAMDKITALAAASDAVLAPPTAPSLERFI